ncbi:hypothetical protein P7C73_g4511, partial [Tremellales sp. Uapishka_1]
DVESLHENTTDTLQTAYRAGRSSADLVSLLDLTPTRPEGALPVQDTPRAGRADTMKMELLDPQPLAARPPKSPPARLSLFPAPPDRTPPPLSAFHTSPPRPSPPASAPLATSPLTESADCGTNDKSFIRWSRTEASSDFGEQSNFSYHAPTSADDGPHRRPKIEGRRSSAGTFGGESHNGKQRRWSAVASSTSGDNPFIDIPQRPGESFWDENEGDEDSRASSAGRRRRPLSMSSASSYSNPQHDTAGQVAALRAQTSPAGSFPSPTQKKPSHRAPETDQAITAHLLKSSAQSDLRIIPRQRLLPALPPSLMLSVPPSTGTPLREGVREEDAEGGSGRKTATPTHGRKGSKLDQLLGQGAEVARVQLELGRRIVDKADDVTMNSQVHALVSVLNCTD